MKITSLLALALLSSPLLHAQRYIAEGVDVDDITNSTLFYDSGKGTFWYNKDSYQSQSMFEILDGSENSPTLAAVMGDWKDRLIPAFLEHHYYMDGMLASIANDDLTCWYHTGANTLEYWQQSYGVFAEKEAVSGYAYNTQYTSQLAGAQSLDLTRLFFDSFINETSSQAVAAEWYLVGSKGYETSSKLKDGVSSSDGGYFAKYFPSVPEGSIHASGTNYLALSTLSSTAAVADTLAVALGYKKQSDGTYKPSAKGQLAALNLTSAGGGNHVITCYGFEMTATDGVFALYVVDSDDESYGIIKIYAKRVNGKFMLYSDEATSTSWSTYNNDQWQLISTSYIDTPESLKQLESSYSQADNAQIWSGGSGIWGGTDATDDGGVATYNSGWVRYASNTVDESFNGHFYSKDESGRAVVFNDYVDEAGSPTTERNISLAKNVAAPSVTIANDSIAYSFEGNDYSLTADSLIKEGSSSATFRNTTLIVQDVQVREGSFEMDNTQLTGSMSVSSGAELHVTGTGNSISDTLTLHAGASLEFSNSNDTLTVNNLVIDKNFQSSGTTVGTLIVEGELRVESTADVARMTRLSGIDLLSVTPVTEATLNANLDLRSADALTMSGALSLGGELMLSSMSKLTLDFAGTPLLDENNYLMLFTDIAGISIDGETADAATDYTQYLELSPETLASLGEDAALKYDAATGQLYVETEAVPEPSSSALSLLALAALAARRRRNRG